MIIEVPGPVRRLAGATSGAALAAALVAGCTGPGADEAGRAAQLFERLTTIDAGQACDLLSGHTREAVEKASKKLCPDAIGDEDALKGDSALRQVDVFGHDALVTFDNDVVFLARFPEGWKVTAAGCTPSSNEDQPFDCAVSGG